MKDIETQVASALAEAFGLSINSVQKICTETKERPLYKVNAPWKNLLGDLSRYCAEIKNQEKIQPAAKGGFNSVIATLLTLCLHNVENAAQLKEACAFLPENWVPDNQLFQHMFRNMCKMARTQGLQA